MNIKLNTQQLHFLIKDKNVNTWTALIANMYIINETCTNAGEILCNCTDSLRTSEAFIESAIPFWQHNLEKTITKN